MTHIAFIGLGAMGRRMAQNLVASGETVKTFTPSGRRIEGAEGCGSALEAATDARAVLVMVTDDAASGEVWAAMEPALTTDTLCVECSTLSPGHTRQLGAGHAEKGRAFLEAPVAGSRPQAEAAELVFLLGGPAEAKAAFAPLAAIMGRASVDAGEVGQGAALKLVVNALLGLQTAALSELLRYGERQGLAPETLMQLLGPTPVLSPSAAAMGGLIAAGKTDPNFTIDLIVKDLGYLTADIGEAPLMQAVQERFEAARAKGQGDRNITAV